MPDAVDAVASPRRVIAGNRLAGVDGLRALAACWVVLFHIHAFSGATIHGIPGLDLFLRSGSTGVSLFLVLSGFCLYAPFAGPTGRRFKTGHFFRRRARRLLPAYMTTLAITLPVLVIAGGAIGLTSLSPSQAFGQGVAHAFMVHPLAAGTFYAVNGAYWSLGLEWQLYLTLPLLILGARRFGLLPILVGVVAVNVVFRLALAVAVNHHLVEGLVASAVLPNLFPGRWAEFAFGMLAAELYAGGYLGRWVHRYGWAAIPMVCVCLGVAGTPLGHILFGALFCIVLLVVLEGTSPVAHLAGWRPLAALGTMSYSLYLVHQPIVQATEDLLRSHGASPTLTFVIGLLLFPALVGVALLLFLGVERRTLVDHRAREAVAADSVVTQPVQATTMAAQTTPA
jgi:peptidoglycan/LPS O-acetylase OafA/YrhL